jgi:hypothetical protein
MMNIMENPDIVGSIFDVEIHILLMYETQYSKRGSKREYSKQNNIFFIFFKQNIISILYTKCILNAKV